MSKVVVILDNGHGVDTKGKCSPDHSLYEWAWTREIVSMLYEALVCNGIDSVYLVPEDEDIPLAERVAREREITRQAKGAGKETVLVSVHINAAGGDGEWKEARGWSGWIAQSASEKSKRLARLLFDQARAMDLLGNRSIPKEHYWVAPFYITTHTSCPAVLTENMFQDNKRDVRYLLSDKGKREIVRLHVNALKEYVAGMR